MTPEIKEDFTAQMFEETFIKLRDRPGLYSEEFMMSPKEFETAEALLKRGWENLTQHEKDWLQWLKIRGLR